MLPEPGRRLPPGYPEEAARRISEVLLPGSSLIISDEGLSRETGKDTDFVVFMSGEPQGGAASRGTAMAQQDAPGDRERPHRQKRKTTRFRAHARGGMRRSGGSTSFLPIFRF